MRSKRRAAAYFEVVERSAPYGENRYTSGSEPVLIGMDCAYRGPMRQKTLRLYKTRVKIKF